MLQLLASACDRFQRKHVRGAVQIFALSLLMPTLLPAQDYQSSFDAATKFDRSKTPATWHDGIEVDAPTGRLNYSWSLGPGLGIRGLLYQPTVTGSWAPTITVGHEPHIVAFKGVAPNGPIMVHLERAKASLSYPTGGDLTPGYLEWPLLRNATSEPAHFVGPDGKDTTLSLKPGDLANPGTLPDCVKDFKIPQVGGEWRLTSADSPIVMAHGRGGEVMVGLESDGLPQAWLWDLVVDSETDNLPVYFRGDTPADNTRYKFKLPQMVLVIKGDVAYSYRLDHGLYSRVQTLRDVGEVELLNGNNMHFNPAMVETDSDLGEVLDPFYKSVDGQGNITWRIMSIRKAVYRLVGIHNRHNDSISFTYPAETPADPCIRARLVVNGSATEATIRISQPSIVPGTSVLSTDVTYAGGQMQYAYKVQWAQTPMPSQGVKDSIANQQHHVPAGVTSCFPESPNTWAWLPTLITDKNTQQSISLDVGIVWEGNWLGELYRLTGIRSVTFPGRKVSFEWKDYGFRPNAMSFSLCREWNGYRGQVWNTTSIDGLRASAVIAMGCGVIRIDETDLLTSATRSTFHTRLVPVPDPQIDTKWTKTRFCAQITHPDGSTTQTYYVEPLNDGRYGGPTDCLYIEQMRTLAHLKHGIQEIREFAPGAPIDDPEMAQFYTPDGSGAWKVTRFDLWDLHAVGNPVGALTNGSQPYPRRTRVWNKLDHTYSESVKEDWDASARAWKIERTRVKELASTDSGSITIWADPAPSGSADDTSFSSVERKETTYLQGSETLWRFAQMTREKHGFPRDETQATAGDARRETFWMPEKGYTLNQRLNRVNVSSFGELTLTYAYPSDDVGLPSSAMIGSLTLTGTGDTVNLVGGQVGISAYEYDDWGRIKTISPRLTGLHTWSLRQVARADGKATSQWDANGLETRVTYDPAGRLKTATLPGEVATVYAYDADGLGVTLTRGTFQESRLRFNGFGELVREVRVANGQSSHKCYGYNDIGKRTWETVWLPGEGEDSGWNLPNAEGDVPAHKETRCDEWMPVIAGEDPYCLSWSTLEIPMVYGNKATHTDYDPYGRVERVRDPNGQILDTTYGSGASARTKTITRTNLETGSTSTTFVADERGRLWKVIDGLAQTTTYQYDPAGRIRRVDQVDPVTGQIQTRTWTYDRQGRLVQLVQPESGQTSYSSFDVKGNPWLTSYLGNGSTAVTGLRRTFDSLGRVLTVTSDTGQTYGGPFADVNQAFGYDGDLASGATFTALSFGSGLNRMTYSRDKGVEQAYLYGDGGGRLSELRTRIWDQDVNQGASEEFSQSFSYDAGFGFRTGETRPSGQTVQCGWDSGMGQPLFATYGNVPNLVTATYDPTSWCLTSLSGASYLSKFTYSPDQVRLASIFHTNAGNGTGLGTGVPSLQNLTLNYTYDRAGRMTSIKETLGTDVQSDTFSYDELDRLVSCSMITVDHKSRVDQSMRNANVTRGTSPVVPMAYDAFGNLLACSSKIYPVGQVAKAVPWSPANNFQATLADTMTMAANNRLPSRLGGVSTGAEYDSLGNLTSIWTKAGLSTGALTLAYDRLGRVDTMWDSARGVKEVYRYTTDGLRCVVEEWLNNTLQKRSYHIYNDQRQLVSLFERVPGGTKVWKRDVIYLGTREIAESTPGIGTAPIQVRIIQCDHLGSPRFTLDAATRKVVGYQKYMPFGESLDQGGSPVTAKGFTNHEQTDPSGLIYMQARFYLPMYGRFASPDPARDQHFEDTQSWNIYSYVRNQPISMTDPTGLEAYLANEEAKNALEASIKKGLSPSERSRVVIGEQMKDGRYQISVTPGAKGSNDSDALRGLAYVCGTESGKTWTISMASPKDVESKGGQDALAATGATNAAGGELKGNTPTSQMASFTNVTTFFAALGDGKETKKICREEGAANKTGAAPLQRAPSVATAITWA